MKITEIERIPAGDYPGGAAGMIYGPAKMSALMSVAKPLPGYEQQGWLYAARIGQVFADISVIDPNAKIPNQVVGELTLEKNPNFPLQPAYQVELINVAEKYRGKGIANAMYNIALNVNKLVLLAGHAQTPNGRRNWVILMDKIPNVEVQGYVMVNDEMFQQQVNRSNETVDALIQKLINIGWDYIGEHFFNKRVFAFPVKKLSSAGRELTNALGKDIKIYNSDYDGMEMGLYARSALP